MQRPAGSLWCVCVFLAAFPWFFPILDMSAQAAAPEKPVEKIPCPDTAPGMRAKLPMQPDGITRLSFIEVCPEYLEEYRKFAAEVGETSLREEPGVLAMYAVAEKDDPCRITILEIYASQAAYKAHIASPHFRKYKQGTLKMVKSLRLADQEPLNPASRLNNFMVDGR